MCFQSPTPTCKFDDPRGDLFLPTLRGVFHDSNKIIIIIYLILNVLRCDFCQFVSKKQLNYNENYLLFSSRTMW